VSNDGDSGCSSLYVVALRSSGQLLLRFAKSILSVRSCFDSISLRSARTEKNPNAESKFVSRRFIAPESKGLSTTGGEAECRVEACRLRRRIAPDSKRLNRNGHLGLYQAPSSCGVLRRR
jgi:hypothetical protein